MYRVGKHGSIYKVKKHAKNRKGGGKKSYRTKAAARRAAKRRGRK